jgi:hypothetical protein
MRRHRRLTFESLESRDMYSGDSALLSYLASHQPTASAPPSPQQLSSTPASQRWDWLAGTVWYVPTENMLAYTTQPDLTAPTAIADQTLWFISQSHNGQFSGEALVQLSSEPLQTKALSGIITPDGQVRITFSSNTSDVAPTIGIGQMRFVDGQVRFQMQMASGTDTIIAHWAYQSDLTPGITPADPTSASTNGDPLDDRWSWLAGTHWALSDETLLGTKVPGIFTINDYVNGYFWGSGTGTNAFNVFGSITPNGNVLILASVDGASATSQAGFFLQTPSGGIVTLRSYEDSPGDGIAWQVGASSVGVAEFIPPSEATNFSIPGQTASVQSLGQNALPATDVPATWPADGALTNAMPWAPAYGTLAPLVGVTRVESAEAGALGNFVALARAGHGAILKDQPTEKSDAKNTRSAKVVEELPSPDRSKISESARQDRRMIASSIEPF